MHINQSITTLGKAAAAGLFISNWDFLERDWTRRAQERPEGELYVYDIEGRVIGWVDGEEAEYSTLVEFEEAHDSAFEEFWQQLKLELWV